MINPVVGGALISGGANLIGGLFSQSNARDAYRHRYRDTVYDMKKAGLNPALAYGQNPGGGAQTADFGDIGSEAMQGGAQAASAKQAAAQTDLTKAQANLLKAQTAELSRRPFLENQNLLLEGEFTSAKTALAGEDRGLRRWEIAIARANADVAEQTRGARITTAKADALRAERIAELTGLDLPQARALANFYRSRYGRMSPYTREGLSNAKDLASLFKSGNNGGIEIHNYPRR